MVTVPKVELVHTDQFLFLFWVIYPHLALRGENTNKNSGQSYREAWGGGLLEPQSARPRDTKDTPCVPNMGWQWGSTQRKVKEHTQNTCIFQRTRIFKRLHLIVLLACVDPLHFRMHSRQKQWSQWAMWSAKGGEGMKVWSAKGGEGVKVWSAKGGCGGGRCGQPKEGRVWGSAQMHPSTQQ